MIGSRLDWYGVPVIRVRRESDEWTDDDGALHPLSAAKHSINLFNEGISG